ARALRAEALRRIAALVGSDAELDEVLKFSVIELARLLKADVAAVFFLDPVRNELSAHQASIYGVPAELHARLGKVPVDEKFASFMVSYSRRAFLSDDATLDERVLPVYRHLIETLDVHAVMDVPLVYRGRGVGELMVGSRRPGHFNRSDIQLASTVANQLAAAVERASLVTQTDETLRRQADTISQAALLSRDYHTITDLPLLLRRVYQDACNLAGVECGSLVLTDEQGQITHYEGEEIPVPDVLLDILVVEDYERPPEDLPPALRRPPHQGVASALFAPLAYRERRLGTLVLHAARAGHFDAVIEQAVAMLASQAVVAVENLRHQQRQAEQLQQLTLRVQTWQRMMEHLLQSPAETSLPSLLQEIASDVRTLLPEAAVVIGRRDEGDVVRWEAGAGISPEALRRLRQHTVTWTDVQAVLQPDYLLLHSYLIPASAGLPSWLKPLSAGPEGEHVLIQPLQSGVEPQGVLLAAPVSEASGAQRHNLDLLNDFSRQIARLLDEYRYFEATGQRVVALEKELLRWQERGVRGWFNAPRIEALVELVNRVSLQAEPEALRAALGEGLVAALGFDGALMLESGDGDVPLLRRFGRLPAPEKVNLSTLLGQRNPLQVSLQQRRAFFVADRATESEWRSSPLLDALQARAFVCLPLLTHSAAPAVLLGIVSEPVDEFTPQDEFLFTLLAQQSANALDNLVLLTETSQKLRDMHLLLDFSRRLSGADEQGVLDNLLESALEIVQPAQAGMVVMAEADGSLRPRLARGYGRDSALRAVDFAGSNNLVHAVFTAGRARRVGEIDFAVDYNLGQEALIHYQEAVGEKVPLSSLLVPLVSERQTLGVLVLDNFERIHAFPGDEQNLVVSLARQAALALENLLLLETVAQRAAQLQALNQASAVLVAQLEAENLPAALLDALQDVLVFDAATLWLRQGDELVIRAVRGFERPDDLIGVSTAVEDSRLFAAMRAGEGPIYVPDVRADERFPGSEADRLTWLAAPLAAKGEMLGVLVIEKHEADFYSEEQRQVFSTFVNQAAVALQNADLYRQTLERSQQLDQRARRLARINRFAESLVRSLDVGEIVSYLGDELADVFPSAGVVVVLQEGDEHQVVYEAPSYPDEGGTLPDAPVFAHLAGTRGVFTTDRAGEEELLRPLAPWMQSRDVNSLVAFPLAVGETVLGFVLVYSSRGERFSAAEVELVQILGNQAAVALQNAVLFERTRRFTEELEARVEERTRELEREHYRSRSLLRIMRELSASLDLDHVLNRTLAVLNDITGAEQSTILLSRPGESTFYYRAALGYTSPPPIGGRQTSLPVDQGLAGWIYEHRKGVLLHNILEDVRWLHEGGAQPEHRSAIGVPLLVGEEMLGVMLLFHRQPHQFNADQLEMAQAAANQIAVAINNAELFGLIRQQSEELGEMLRQQQIETSRSRAILEAVADGVMVTDSRGRITLFNDSAGRIMRLQPEKVLGKSLADFRGLFGAATQAWLDQIAAWSKRGPAVGVADTFADRFTLDDQRVVAVHLAPVFFNQEFLGTVSIFRDITYEVEVDRLKSEFVATVSHELRTPMTSIKGYVEILLMGAAGKLTPQQEDFLKVVRENTERLNILVNDLLDVSRIEAGKVHLVMQSLRLQDIIPDEVAEFERLAGEEKELHFVVDVPAELPPVRGDDARVRQVIANLVSNAYHYTPSGGHVWVRARALEDEVQVDVQDDGIGIPPEDQERIFERFYRGEDPLVMATAGTGLGLSIVQQLIEMHGGRIWVQSTGVPGEGSTFSFTLPQYHTQRG
ncbi:MAG: GAF domain-containing protein, partial [Anaerolineae bacterium]